LERAESVDEPIYVPVIGQEDGSMEIYCTMPGYTGEPIVPQEPCGIKPPRLPLNHPRSKPLHGQTRMKKVQMKSKLRYILSIGVIISVAFGSVIYFGIILQFTEGTKIEQPHEGKEIIHGFVIHFNNMLNI